MSQGNATPIQGTTGYLQISNAIGTYPNYITQAGTTTTFDQDYPNVITVTGWTLTAAETAVVYGQSLWMFEPVAGQIAFGKWSLDSTTLTVNCIDGFPKWTTTVTTGLASVIPNRDVKAFDQCCVQNIGTSDVKVNGFTISNQGDHINLTREGNGQFPVIIDASNDAIAQVTTGLI